MFTTTSCSRRLEAADLGKWWYDGWEVVSETFQPPPFSGNRNGSWCYVFKRHYVAT